MTDLDPSCPPQAWDTSPRVRPPPWRRCSLRRPALALDLDHGHDVYGMAFGRFDRAHGTDELGRLPTSDR